MRARVETEKDDEIRRLRSELWLARFAMIQLMSEPAKFILDERYGVASFEDLGKWTHWAISALVDLALQEAQVGHDLRPRAPCPLCKSGPSSGYLDGYALPLGLSRHLEGYRNSAKCSVFQAAFAMVREHLIEERDNPGGRPNWRSAALSPPPWK